MVNVHSKFEKVNLSDAVLEVATWLDEQLRTAKFGEIGVSLTVHDGRITRLSKTVTEKLPMNGVSK